MFGAAIFPKGRFDRAPAGKRLVAAGNGVATRAIGQSRKISAALDLRELLRI